MAIAERDRQVAEFKEVSRTVEKEMRRKWQAQIDAWLADKSKSNLYVVEGGKNGKSFGHFCE